MFAPAVTRMLYQRVVKPLAFLCDPEWVHDAAVRVGVLLGASRVARRVLTGLYAYQYPALEQTVAGIRFPNPIGLAAGFDKNAELLRVLPSIGFGFVEVGSVTAQPCAGNARPRLWRLPDVRGLLVHYGLKNEGAQVIAERVRRQSCAIPVGVSIAKTNVPTCVSVEEGVADYRASAALLRGIGEYVTVNISCPNAYGGEPFSVPAHLEALLTELDTLELSSPVFLKCSADTTIEMMDAYIGIVRRHRVAGFILANLTKNYARASFRAPEGMNELRGGVSGKLVEELSTCLIEHVYTATAGKYVIIGVGGVFSAEDAYEKIRAGASLVQLITGMIYEGPQLMGEINAGLVRLLARDGFSSVAEAVGSGVRERRRGGASGA